MILSLLGRQKAINHWSQTGFDPWQRQIVNFGLFVCLALLLLNICKDVNCSKFNRSKNPNNFAETNLESPLASSAYENISCASDKLNQIIFFQCFYFEFPFLDDSFCPSFQSKHSEVKTELNLNFSSVESLGSVDKKICSKLLLLLRPRFTFLGHNMSVNLHLGQICTGPNPTNR